MKKRLLLGVTSALVLGAVAAPTAQAACTPVNTSRGALTAAVVNADVIGADIDATGCDIGVYYDDAGPNLVDASRVHGALEYGVFNDGSDVTVNDSDVFDIGDDPKNGVQRGIGVHFEGNPGDPATGTISDSSIFEYQKNGITVNDSTASANITDTTVTGLGKVEFIAQNGIQISRGADPLDVSGNTVTGNHYTGPSKPTTATGILLFEADVTGRDVGKISSSNTVKQNQANIAYIK